MGRKSGIPCIECDFRFSDDALPGKNKCPNCHTEYRLIVDPVSGNKELKLYAAVGSSSLVSLTKTPEIVKRKCDESLKIEALILHSALPKENECHFCRKELTFATTVRGKIKTGKVYVDKNSTDFIQFKDGSSQVFHNVNTVALPESVAIKTKTVNVCVDCIGNLVKVLPAEKNTVQDRWSKKTGARRQHYSRNVDEGSSGRDEFGKRDITPADKVISHSERYFKRVGG